MYRIFEDKAVAIRMVCDEDIGQIKVLNDENFLKVFESIAKFEYPLLHSIRKAER